MLRWGVGSEGWGHRGRKGGGGTGWARGLPVAQSSSGQQDGAGPLREADGGLGIRT